MDRIFTPENLISLFQAIDLEKLDLILVGGQAINMLSFDNLGADFVLIEQVYIAISINSEGHFSNHPCCILRGLESI
jgi:hypothetical protein